MVNGKERLKLGGFDRRFKVGGEERGNIVIECKN